ncbi:DUF503 domain-containing protein [Tuberibacillus calidus]|jgi:hypothetical protein|uniref:DUF503 domain-containing protein n=1 Tax=Tuberibacillus calidus TaxID=340097 RepID=UPI00040E503B|nr:DUF503 domain-containing protein [Tuberibacillus calidus]
MIIGLLRCECILYNAQSLKNKRSVIQSVLARAKNRFNVAASEIGFQDVWQRAELAFVTVASSKTVAENELRQVLTLIDQNEELDCAKSTWEWL